MSDNVSTGTESVLGDGEDRDLGGRRRRSHASQGVSQTFTNQTQLLAINNNKFVLYVNGPEVFRMVYVQRSTDKKASIRVHGEVSVRGKLRPSDDLLNIIKDLFGSKAYDKSNQTFYVDRDDLRKLFRLSALRAITCGLPCYYIMASKSVKQDDGTRVKVSEVYRGDAHTGNFLFPWAGIENKYPNPKLFFNLNRTPQAFAKYEPKFQTAQERQTYIPYNCASFSFEEKARKENGAVQTTDLDTMTGIDHDAFETFRKKPKAVRAPKPTNAISYTVDDDGQFFEDIARNYLPAFEGKRTRARTSANDVFLSPL